MTTLPHTAPASSADAHVGYFYFLTFDRSRKQYKTFSCTIIVFISIFKYNLNDRE